MALRKSRRQFVMNSASVAALYASGLIPSPAAVVAAPLPAPAPTVEDKGLGAKVAARPSDNADVSVRLTYLAGLVARQEYAADHGDTDAADTLARLNRCLDLPIDCLDGTFARRVLSA